LFQQYDHAYMTIEEKAGLEELETARAHRKTIASDLKVAEYRVEEGETLLQSLRTEVLEGQLCLREADEHIGFIRDFLQKQKMDRLTRTPTSHQERPGSPPLNSPPASYAPSKTSADDLDDLISEVVEESSTEEEGVELSPGLAVSKEDSKKVLQDLEDPDLG
jgi:hypothetical protein